jgi:peptide/nickel transport system permease protein
MKSLSPTRLLWQRFLERRIAVASLCVLVLLVAAAAGAPLVALSLGIDSSSVDLLQRLAGPSAEHPLGTDELGRDVLLRLLEGGQVSLFVGLVAAVAAAVIGTAIGLAAGWNGGLADTFLMRFTDSVIALPRLPLLIVLAAIDLKKLGLPESEYSSLWRIVVLTALLGWTTVARLVRGATLSVRTRDFVRAATALGARPLRIVLVHVLPNVASPIVVATTLSVGEIVLLESVLSFLSLGIQPPMASWGNMLTNALELMQSAPQLAIYPGFFIFVTVIAFNLLGDGLQDAMDPRAVRR